MPLKKAADAIAEEKLLSRKSMLLRELLGEHRDDVEFLSGEQQMPKRVRLQRPWCAVTMR